MSFLDSLKKLFSPSGSYDPSYWVTVRCKRCGEEIRTRVDMRNDLSIDYAENGSVASYYCRKILMGDKLCFQQIEVELNFDANHRLVSKDIQGGSFVE